MRFIRAFDPADEIADFDWDARQVVVRGNILETDDLLTAPNRFIVISNASDDSSAAVFGSFDVPDSAPHYLPNRGFVIAQVEDLQITDKAQAAAVARNLAIRQTVFERVSVTTAPDPRHD